LVLTSATKKLIKLAWRLAIDWCVNFFLTATFSDGGYSHRTLVPLKYPPHVVALGSIYVASLLSSFEQPPSPEQSGYRSSHEIAATLSEGQWEQDFQSQVEDLEGILCHDAFSMYFYSLHFFRHRPFYH
jgi:CTD kinase subunit beta